MYLGKKIIELNIHEKRFKKAMQLMKIHIMLEKAEKELKTLTDNGHI